MQTGANPRPGGTTPAGALTTVMRAATPRLAPNTPLVLRIGVVRAGRFVEERVIKQRTAVSIGTSEDATFACRGPARFDLFARAKDGYVARFSAEMSGRLFLGAEVESLEQLRQRLPSRHGIFEVALTDESRGKIVVGDTTFLFQFVHPPPPQPRPQLPLAAKGGLTNRIDWPLTIIAAMSFLLHFGIVGAMYSDWMDGVVDDQHSIAGLVDMMKSIPPPATTETPTDPATPAETKPTETTTTKTVAPTSTTASKPSGNTGPRSGVNDRQAAALADQANQMEMALLAGVSGRSSSVEAALRREIPPVDLSARAASSDGVARTGSDLHMPSGGPAVAGRRNGGLEGLAGPMNNTATTSAGDARVVSAPKFDTQIGVLGGGSVSGADRVVAGLRSRFRACYQKGLNVDATMSGKVVITAKIGPNGEVSSAEVASNAGLSPDVSSCIASAVKLAQFDAQPTATTLSIPVSFLKQ